MFHVQVGDPGPRVYLRPKESIHVPLKYQSFLCNHAMAPQVQQRQDHRAKGMLFMSYTYVSHNVSFTNVFQRFVLLVTSGDHSFVTEKGCYKMNVIQVYQVHLLCGSLDNAAVSYQIVTGAERPTYWQVPAGQEESVQYCCCQNDQGTECTTVFIIQYLVCSGPSLSPCDVLNSLAATLKSLQFPLFPYNHYSEPSKEWQRAPSSPSSFSSLPLCSDTKNTFM